MNNRVLYSKLILLSGLAFASLLRAQPAVPAVDALTDTEGNRITDSVGTPVTDTSKVLATQADVLGAIGQIVNVDNFYSRALQFTTAQTNRPLTMAATIQSRYTYIQDQPTPNFNTFSIPLASLSFSGLLYKDFQEGKNLQYALGFSSASGAAPTPTDAYLLYNVLSTADIANPSLTVALGQQKKPFGLEPQSTDEQQPSINSSLYLTGTTPYNFSDLSARDIGIVVRADALPAVDYGYNFRQPVISAAAAIFNGAGANAVDNNKSKEYTFRVQLAPPVDYYNPLRGLAIGASYDRNDRFLSIAGGATTSAKTFWIYKTNGAGAKTDSTKYTVAAVNANPDTLQATRTRYGADLSYIRTPVNFTAEAVYATQDSAYWNASTKSFQNNQRRSYAGSAAIFLNLGEQYLKQTRNESRLDDWWPFTWQPFFRIDGIDPNIDAVGDWQLAVTPGVNIFFARTTKFQLDWSWRKTENKPAKNAQYLAQFQYGF
jgi:hypothetical protein